MADYHTFEQRRINLQDELEKYLGTTHVYYQPPENFKLQYPAVIYERRNLDSRYANNGVYNVMAEYNVTIIDSDPDSLLVDKMSKFKTSRYIRHFVSNGMNHDVFTIFY